VKHLEDTHEVSERRACTVAAQHRSTQRYQPKERSGDTVLLEEMKKLVKAHPRRGCRHITALLRRDGWRVNYKRVHRLWKQEGFKVPRKRHKKKALGHSANACHKRAATARNDVWTWDFIFDHTVDGRQLKFLSIVDEHTRECLHLDAARSIRAEDVIEVLAELMGRQGVPVHIRSDNGSEFIAEEMRKWLERTGVETLYIEPGAPWQNGYAEHGTWHPHGKTCTTHNGRKNHWETRPQKNSPNIAWASTPPRCARLRIPPCNPPPGDWHEPQKLS
jgi:transposase InsO family protein